MDKATKIISIKQDLEFLIMFLEQAEYYLKLIDKRTEELKNDILETECKPD